MKNLKKYLFGLLLLLVAFALVACGEEAPIDEPEDDDPIEEGPKEVAISKIEVFPTIYDGTEDAPYVLVGQEMYVEAELNDGEECTEVEKWEIDGNTIAEMTVNEEGGIILKGIKAGKAVVTAKNADGTIKDELAIEVAASANAQDVLVAANTEIINKFPKFVAANVELPVPENPFVTIKYKDNITNGIKVKDGVYQCAYDIAKGDVNKQINFTLTYHGQKLDSNTYFYEVKDVEKNVFVIVEKAEKAVKDFFGDLAVDPKTNTAKAKVTENFTGEKAFPTHLDTETVGGDVTLTWASDQSAVTAAGTYSAGDVDKAVLLTATITINYLPATKFDTKTEYYTYADNAYTKVAAPAEADLANYYVKNTTPAAKASVTVIAAGASPEDVIEYFIKQKYCPADGSKITTTVVAFKTSDSSKKYAGLSVEWECDNSAAKWVASKQSYTFAANGDYCFTGTFYYNKKYLSTFLALNGKELDPNQVKECDFYCVYTQQGDTCVWMNGESVVKLSDYGIDEPMDLTTETPAAKPGDVILVTLSYAWKRVVEINVEK